MKIEYFPEIDTVIIALTTKLVVATDAISDDIIVDYDDEPKVVSITLANYSKNVETVGIQTIEISLLAE